MKNHPLSMFQGDLPNDDSTKQTVKLSEKEKQQHEYEKKWKQNPEKFSPSKNIREVLRLERSLDLILSTCSVKEKKTVDLGCGSGFLARRLQKEGAIVTAIDISQKALETFKKEGSANITLLQDFVPETKLKDEEFEIVLAIDLIGDLREKYQRLFFSELHRLINPFGWVFISTAIDINSIDALDRFADLAKTEFNVVNWIYSYHALTIRLKHFFSFPKRLLEEKKKTGLKRKLILFPPLLWGWYFLDFLFKPILYFLQYGRKTNLFLEKVCQALQSSNGISHVICACQRKPLERPGDPVIPPKERPKKKQVWE